MRILFVLPAAFVFALGCAPTVDAPAPFTGTASSEGASRSTRADDDGADDDDAKASGYTGNPKVVEAGDKTGSGSGSSSTSSSVPAAPGLSVWHGHVATTDKVDFGGGDFCNYHVVLTDIEVVMSLDAENHVVSSTVRHTMTETTEECQAAPLGVQHDTYAFNAAKEPLASLVVLHHPDPKNLPQANVTITVDPIDAKRMKGQIVVQRTGGVQPSLDWKVTTDIELTPYE